MQGLQIVLTVIVTYLLGMRMATDCLVRPASGCIRVDRSDDAEHGGQKHAVAESEAEQL